MKSHTLGCGLVLAFLLTGCAGTPPWGAWSKAPSAAQVAAVMHRPETFIYFSRYEVYQDEQTKVYVYRQGPGWTHSYRPPEGVTEAALRESPAVQVALSGSPEQHHAEIRQAHPSDWGQGTAVVMAAP